MEGVGIFMISECSFIPVVDDFIDAIEVFVEVFIYKYISASCGVPRRLRNKKTFLIVSANYSSKNVNSREGISILGKETIEGILGAF